MIDRDYRKFTLAGNDMFRVRAAKKYFSAPQATNPKTRRIYFPERVQSV